MGASLRPPHAVLWDMDGTLVDTEPYWIASEYDIVESFGGTWSDEHAHNLVGFDLLDAGRYIAEHGRVPLTPPEIVDRLLDGVIARMSESLPWRPGALELLDALSADGIPCALVTMSWSRVADAVVGLLPAGTFAAVVTGDMVTRGKPHPEPYVRAADMLGIDPAMCVAFEDSPTGTASARAAGCVTVAIPHVVDVPESPGLHRVSSLTDVDLDVLRSLFEPGRALLDPSTHRA
jgi:HAD superfamily hydrolase (TIGR01509 family)